MPELNVGRRDASSCTISGRIYIIAGRDYRRLERINTIEKLSLADVSNGVAAWQLIQPDDSSFSPRE